MLKTSCHCGAVRVEVARRPTSLTECNCSICRRVGARWAYYSRKSLKITAPADGLQSYSHGRFLYFDHCRHCGCVVLWRPIVPRGETDRMGGNMRLIDDPDALANISVQRFDGAKTWRVLETRTLDQPGW